MLAHWNQGFSIFAVNINIRKNRWGNLRSEHCVYKTQNESNKSQLSRQTGSRNLTGQKTLPTKWGTYMKLVTKYQISAINICWEKCDEKWAYMFNVYKNQQSWQTGSRNLMGPKTLPTIWGTDMKLVTKYQICAINSCWEKCAYMFNVYKNQLSRQTGSRNLMVPKTLPTISVAEMDGRPVAKCD